jgi:ubiquinone/menaquinone biosynthesis C-methylase UbiE
MGTFAIEAARRGALSLGIDFAPAALRSANAVLRAEGVTGAGFIRGDAVQLPLSDGTAGIVLAADVTEHLDDETLRKVFEEAARVLEPGGVFVVYTPSPTHVFERLRDAGAMAQDPSHIGIRPAESLAAAANRAGLRVEELRHLHSQLPVWSTIERGFSRWVPLLRRRIGLVARKPT